MTLEVKRIKGIGKDDFKVYVVRKAFNISSGLDTNVSKLTLIMFKKTNLGSEVYRIIATSDSSSNISYTIDKI